MLVAAALVAVSLVVLPPTGPAAADPWGTVVRVYYNADTGNFGDVDMPSCGSRNITGHFRLAKWEIRSSLPVGSNVLPGTEWDIEVEMHSAWSHPPYGNDGPDPLVLRAQPLGPIEPVGQVHAEYNTSTLLNDQAHYGPGSVGPVKPFGDYGYEFDANSSPGFWDGSDGVNLKMRYRMRATNSGQVTVPKLEITGHDGSVPAGPVACSVPLDWWWNVLPTKSPTAVGESVKVDASYSLVNPADRNGGDHRIHIDVLANDDDPNLEGGPGDTSQVRLSDWDPVTVNGADVRCGTDTQKGLGPDHADFTALSAGPCTYTPPQDFVGHDSFTYEVVQATGRETKKATVSVMVVGNGRPFTLAANFGVPQNTDADRTLTGSIVDLDGDPVSCSPTLTSPVTPAAGSVALAENCDFTWTSTDPFFTGSVTFGYRVCDTSLTVKSKGELGASVTPDPTYSIGFPNDLSTTHTRLCRDGTANLTVYPGGILPPVGMADTDVVDAGYPGDGVGPYTLDIDVLANDWDPNGPVSKDTIVLQILVGPDPAEGTASVVDQQVRFTPADGFSGPVDFTYRLCEDPTLQNPPYGGFPYCGVGGVSLLVIPNEAPIVTDEVVGLGWGQVLTDHDLGANAVDPEGEGITCDTDVHLSDPGAVLSANLTADCKLDLEMVPGEVVVLTYTVCDQHMLANPGYPATPYGADGRSPGGLAPRCTTGTLTVTAAAPPADPEEPVEPGDPEEPVEPADPEEPIEPADPEEPIEPADPEEPVEPADPEEPVDPDDGEPGDPDDGEPGDGDEGAPGDGDEGQPGDGDEGEPGDGDDGGDGPEAETDGEPTGDTGPQTSTPTSEILGAAVTTPETQERAAVLAGSATPLPVTGGSITLALQLAVALMLGGAILAGATQRAVRD